MLVLEKLSPLPKEGLFPTKITGYQKGSRMLQECIFSPNKQLQGNSEPVDLNLQTCDKRNISLNSPTFPPPLPSMKTRLLPPLVQVTPIRNVPWPQSVLNVDGRRHPRHSPKYDPSPVDSLGGWSVGPLVGRPICVRHCLGSKIHAKVLFCVM